MPDNTIGGTPTATLQQVESNRLREREQSETEVNTNTAQAQPQQNAPADVEVDLSQEARDLSLSTVEQLAAPNQSAETQTTTVEEAATPPEPETATEDNAPPARENESQVTRRFDQSANEALGTVIDIRS